MKILLSFFLLSIAIQAKAAPDTNAILDSWNTIHTKQTIPGRNINVNLANTIGDWPALQELHAEAINIWQNYLNCAGNNHEQAVQMYFSNTCAAAENATKQYRAKVRSYLLSSLFKDFSTLKIFSCPESDPTCDYDLQGNNASELDRLMNNPRMNDLLGQLVNRQRQDLFSSVNSPRLHPFFTQIIVEQTALAYPFPYPEIVCTGFLCSQKVLTYKQMPEIYYKKFENDPNLQWTLIQRAITEFTSTGTFSTNNLSPEALEYITDIRATFAAFRVLRLLSIGKHSCDEYGLNTTLTQKVFFAMEGGFYKKSYFNTKVFYHDLPFELASRSVSLCGEKVRRTIGWYSYQTETLDYLQEAQRWIQLGRQF